MPATQEAKIAFKPRTLAHEQRPDAPEGKWEMSIPKGKSRIVQTAAEKGGDPGLLIMVRLDKADDEKNESFQGSLLPIRLYFYDQENPEKRKGANMMLRNAMDLAEACELELKDVYPDEIRDVGDLQDILDKLEGKRFDGWTTHRRGSMPNGDPTLNVDIRFKEPGTGLQTSRADADEEEEEKPARRNGNGAAKTNGKSRR